MTIRFSPALFINYHWRDLYKFIIEQCRKCITISHVKRPLAFGVFFFVISATRCADSKYLTKLMETEVGEHRIHPLRDGTITPKVHSVKCGILLLCNWVPESVCVFIHIFHHYRVLSQLADLGWVYLVRFKMFRQLAQLYSHFCPNPVCLSRIRQTAELPRTKAAQPRSSSWWNTLYTVVN